MIARKKKKKKERSVDDLFGECVKQTQDLTNLLLNLFENFGIAREIVEGPCKEGGCGLVSRKLDQTKEEEKKREEKRKRSVTIAETKIRDRREEERD